MFYWQKRRFMSLAVLFFVFLALSGFGCKGLTSTEKQAIKPVSLEYWTIYDDVDEIENLIKSYTVKRSYLTVNVKQLRESEVYTKLVEELAEDRGPDIISIHTRMLPAYRSKLDTMPASVTDVTVQTVKKKLGTEQIVSMGRVNLPSALQIENEYIKTVKDDVISAGQIYGLPLSVDTMALFYNKDLLDRAGIAEAPKNWTEFQKDVKKLTKFDSTGKKITQSGTALGTGNNIDGFDDLLYILFEQSGVSFVDRNGKPVFNSSSEDSSGLSQGMSVLNFYTDFANANKDTYSWDASKNNAFDEFISGKVAFFFGYSYHQDLIKSRAPQMNVKVLPLFQLNENQAVNVANYWIQSVVKKSNHKNEAWALINYLAHSSAAKEYIEKTGRPSAVRAYVTAQQQNKDLAPFVTNLLVANNWYRGKSYVSAKAALAYMVAEWQKIPSDSNKTIEYWDNLLNYAVAQVNQTL
jgi:multiple sugar transport system substrate-binding protein